MGWNLRARLTPTLAQAASRTANTESAQVDDWVHEISATPNITSSPPLATRRFNTRYLPPNIRDRSSAVLPNLLSGEGIKLFWFQLASFRPSQRLGTQGVAQEPARLRKSPPLAVPTRFEFLDDYLTQKNRPIDLDRALAAIKLRRAAEIFYPKNTVARLTPHQLQNQVNKGDLQNMLDRAGNKAVLQQDLEALLKEIQSDPRSENRGIRPGDGHASGYRIPGAQVTDTSAYKAKTQLRKKPPTHFNRTDLTDLAAGHLMAAFNIDEQAYLDGVARAGWREGRHTVASRLPLLALQAALAGIINPGSDALVHLIGHPLTQSLAAPLIAGEARIWTNVEESQLRSGGHPVVVSEITNSEHMGVVAESVEKAVADLRQATTLFLRQSMPNMSQADLSQITKNSNILDSIVKLFDTANSDYKKRSGHVKSQAYGKAYGTLPNVVTAAATVVAPIPPAGHFIAIGLLVLSLIMTMEGGRLDETRNKFRYAHRANTKGADFLTLEGRELHYSKLTTAHVNEAQLRKAFVTGPENRVADIRAVYTDQVGSLVRKRLDTKTKLQELYNEITAGQTAALSPSALNEWRLSLDQNTRYKLNPHERTLDELDSEIIEFKRQIANFESEDAERWRSIPADSIIGRCLDNPKALESAARRVAYRKPGEQASQIMQRIAQLSHAPFATSETQPIDDGLNAAATYGTVDADTAEDAGLGAAIGGNTVNVLATPEVRVDKARNQKLFTTEASSITNSLADWNFKINEGTDQERTINLTGTRDFDLYHHDFLERKLRVIKALPASLLSGPKGLLNQAKVIVARGNATQAMEEALQAMEMRGLEKVATSPNAPRVQSFSGLMDQFSDFVVATTS